MFVTTFVVRSPSAAKPSLEAIEAAGYELRRHPFEQVRGMNLATMEEYETWQTSMPAAELEAIALEHGSISSIAPTSNEAWR